MPAEWATSIVRSIFMGKGMIHHRSCYIAEKLLQPGIKVVEWMIVKATKNSDL